MKSRFWIGFSTLHEQWHGQQSGGTGREDIGATAAVFYLFLKFERDVLRRRSCGSTGIGWGIILPVKMVKMLTYIHLYTHTHVDIENRQTHTRSKWESERYPLSTVLNRSISLRA